MDVREQMSQEKQLYVIPEEIPANERTAFHGAAAAASKAGKKSFKFNGKTHPVTMKKDTAKAITSQNETSHDDSEMDPEDKKEKLKKKNGKSMKGDTAEMNPKMGDENKKGAAMEQKEFKEDVKLDEVSTHTMKGLEPKFSTGVFLPKSTVARALGPGNKVRKNFQQFHVFDNKKDAEKKAKQIGGRVIIGRGEDKGKYASVKEFTIRDKLMMVLEGDRAKHYRGATRPETDDDKLSGAGAKKMKADIQGNAADPDLVSKGHDDASKAGKVTKPAKKRANDKDEGDKRIINEPEDITKKGVKKESRDGLAATINAYFSMQESLKYVTQDKTGPLTRSIDIIDRELTKLEKYGLKDEGQDDRETKKLTAAATREYQKQVKKLGRALDDVRSSIY